MIVDYRSDTFVVSSATVDSSRGTYRFSAPAVPSATVECPGSRCSMNSMTLREMYLLVSKCMEDASIVLQHAESQPMQVAPSSARTETVFHLESIVSGNVSWADDQKLYIYRAVVS